MPQIDFYFDFRSPYSHLALTQLRNWPLRLRYRPFDVAAAMQLVGNVPTSVTCPAKGRYIRQDLQRWADLYGIAFQRNPNMKQIDTLRLLRAALLVADDGAQADALVPAIFDALWRAPRELATLDDVLALAEGAGVRGHALAQIDDPGTQAALATASAAAASRGVFGAPTIFVGDDMFFGNDRLAFVRHALEAP